MMTDGPDLETSESRRNAVVCTCGSISHDRGKKTHVNLSLDCPTHGTKSSWYNSPTVAARRREQEHRLRRLTIKAGIAQRIGIGCSSGDVIEEPGVCDVCDQARNVLAQEASDS